MNPDDRIALCLSGGGFRASLFHLGVMRRLWEIGVLGRVHTVSSVSGGSIISAFVANRLVASGHGGFEQITDWSEEIAVPFRAFTSRDLRSGPILRHGLWNWAAPGFLARSMVKRYRKRLTSLALAELPERPRFVLCATDVAFGVNWIFSRKRVGDYLAGYAATPPDLPLAVAVAASACFPPLFGPMRVGIPAAAFKGGRYQGADRDRIMAGLSLTDGGVYDNLGLEPALRNHDIAIVSDAGGPFPFVASKTPVLRYMRYPSLVMKQVSSLRRRQLMSLIDDNRRSCELAEEKDDCRVAVTNRPCAHAEHGDCRDHDRRRSINRGVYLGIQSDVEGYRTAGTPDSDWPGYPKQLVKSTIARVRTDLDRFTTAEQSVLENHGYMLAEAAMRRHLPDLESTDTAPFALPNPDFVAPEVAARALRDSHRRFSLSRLFGAPGRGNRSTSTS